MTNHKIAIFLRNVTGGGAEQVMVNLACGFAEKGIKIDFLLTKKEGQYLDHISKNIKVIDFESEKLDGNFKLPTGFQSLRSLPKLISYLRREKPTILLSALHFANEIAILGKKLSGVSTRLIITEHTTLSIEAKQVQVISSRLAPLTSKFLYPFADGIVTVSQGSANDLSQLTGIPLNKIKVIYNPVITTDFKAKMMESVEHPWFKSGQPPVIIGVGRLVTQKDFSTLIRAFAKVREKKNVRLMMLGDGGEAEKLKNLAKELSIEEYVSWMGWVDNPLPYIKRASVCVVSSKWEGFCNVVVESMAVGTPLISTNCPSGPIETLDNGKYGELVPVGDSGAISEAILKVLSGQIKSVDSDWLKQFTSEVVVQKYIDFLGIKSN